MLSRVKTYFWIALGIGAFYFLLTHHIIFSGFREFDLLKKEELTLEYTFYSVRTKSPYEILKVDILRDAGIEDILLKRGIISEQRLDQVLERIDAMKAREEGPSE
ncbi:MAG: hypothetical protein P8X96_05550 [Desulfobacteraceae bacterium]